MSGGMEDLHRQDRDAFTNAGQYNNTGVESDPKGQVEEVDIQALADNTGQREFNADSDSDEEVPSSQPPSTANPSATTAPTTNGNSNTDTHAAAQPSIDVGINQGTTITPQGIDLSSLMNLIANTITASVSSLKDEIEKKERAADVKRSAEMAELYALRDQLQQAREQTSPSKVPPIANLHIPVSAATPESKKTFASATSTNSNFSSVKSFPNIPTLQPSTPLNAQKNPPANPYHKPSPNFHQTVGTGARATIIHTVPSSVKYRQLAPIEYESIVNKHRGVIPTGAFYADAPLHEHNLLWIKAMAKADEIRKLRCDDNESDISFVAVGHHFIDSIGLFEKYHTVELYKAFEVKVTQDPKDERCIGLFAIWLISPQGMTEEEQIKKLHFFEEGTTLTWNLLGH
jgi:hypothetical protein